MPRLQPVDGPVAGASDLSTPQDRASSRALGSLAALGAVLVTARWWQQADGLPLSWRPPGAEALFLLPSVPVVGLLVLRALVVQPTDEAGAHHLARRTARWAATWAAANALWLLLTVADLYGTGPAGLVGADNLLAVMGASEVAGPRLTLLWVSLLVALFGGRLAARSTAAGQLLLVSAALLAAAPVISTGPGHGHGSALHPLVQLVGGVQLLALLVWSGGVATAAVLRAAPEQARRRLRRHGVVLTTSAALVGATVVAAAALRPERKVAASTVLLQLTAVAVVLAVAHRHRRRVVDGTDGGERFLVPALVAADVAALIAVGALGVLPAIA